MNIKGKQISCVDKKGSIDLRPELNALAEKLGADSQVDLVAKLIDIANAHLERESNKKEPSLSLTMRDKIQAAIDAQIAINTSAELGDWIGRGNNRRFVKYEQRCITPKWIAVTTNLSTESGKAIDLYLSDKATIEAIQEHNDWLLSENGFSYRNESERGKEIANFNRRCSRVANIVAKKANDTSKDSDLNTDDEDVVIPV